MDSNTCQEAPPTYESISNLTSGLVQDAFAAQLPPPYSSLNTPIASGSTPQDIGIAHYRPPEPAWESEARDSQFYWFRTIRRDGQPQFQCGINTHDGTRRYGEVPDHFFTCKIMPRAGYTRSMITETCKNVALALKLHRKNHRGDCSVCDFRHVQGKRIGCPASVHSMVRAQWLGTMRSHDEACSCRCFHVDSHGTPITDDASGTPQYHAGIDRQVVNRGLETPEDGRVYQPWESASMKFSSIDTYWTRMVKNGDEIWQQYGISERQSDGQPEFFFTCKMNPRKGKNEQIIREVCMGIASIMRGHRSTNYNRCACNFQTWRRPGGPGGCRVSWYHLNKRMTRHMIDFLMRSHDEVCSCGCFDIGSGEDADLSGQWLRD
jgi:hypothetical protein